MADFCVDITAKLDTLATTELLTVKAGKLEQVDIGVRAAIDVLIRLWLIEADRLAILRAEVKARDMVFGIFEI